MPKHFEYLICLFEIKVFLALFYFSDYRKGYTSTFGLRTRLWMAN